ncbi:MAG: hypothetical protein KDK03_09730 [Rhodobacteraceae bacterium]|nr:hypothetical protein [Paracoccaceae bacterium]
MTLSAHQAIAVRRAFPGAEIKGDQILVGIWRMQLIGDQLTLPTARRPDDPHLNASDEAMESWTRLREVLGC